MVSRERELLAFTPRTGSHTLFPSELDDQVNRIEIEKQGRRSVVRLITGRLFFCPFREIFMYPRKIQ